MFDFIIMFLLTNRIAISFQLIYFTFLDVISFSLTEYKIELFYHDRPTPIFELSKTESTHFL